MPLSYCIMPVRSPPGRAKLVTKPEPTGSETPTTAAVRVRAARRVVTCFLIGILLGASIGFLLGAAINALKS